MSELNGSILNEIAFKDTPEWLNSQFFDKIIENINGTRSEVKLLSVKPAVGVGENYVAKLFRVKVESIHNSKTITHSFILKFMSNTADFVKEFGVFPKEMQMYSEIIPAVENEYKRIGEAVKFSPKCHLVSSEPIEILVFDDLNICGYSVQDRFKGLNFDHCIMFLTKLAKFHAASAVYVEKEDKIDVKLLTPYKIEQKEVMQNMMSMSFQLYLEALKNNVILKKYAHKVVSDCY